MAENYGEGTTSSFSQNSTASPPWEFDDYGQRVLVGILYLVISVVGTVGNSLVIAAVILSKKLRTATNAFVVNLSVADLLTSLVIPWHAIATLGRHGLPVGEWVCSVATVAQVTTIGCSIYTLASVGLNRLLLITRPTTAYRAVFTPRKIAVWLALTWLIPLLVNLLPPLLNVGAVGYNEKFHHCGFTSHPLTDVYITTVVAVLYPIPLITIIVCYIFIWRHLNRHTKRMVNSSKEHVVSTIPSIPSEASKSLDASGSQPASSPRRAGTVRSSRMMSRRQNEITKNMFYVVCAFLLCLTPYAVCLFLAAAGPAIPYVIAIVFFNSCINPFIYATKHRDFKTVFGCILRRQWDQIPEPSESLKAIRRRCC